VDQEEDQAENVNQEYRMPSACEIKMEQVDQED
jgi:hypothetical protein